MNNQEKQIFCTTQIIILKKFIITTISLIKTNNMILKNYNFNTEKF